MALAPQWLWANGRRSAASADLDLGTRTGASTTKAAEDVQLVG